MSPEEKAKDYATYYFKLIAEKAGVKWRGDNDTEIEIMIEAIINAAVDAAIAAARGAEPEIEGEAE